MEEKTFEKNVIPGRT